MRTLKNLSPAPLRIPLPGGKTLHLGPGKSACVRNGVIEHPAMMKLRDGGLVELGDATAGGPATTGLFVRGDVRANGISGSRR